MASRMPHERPSKDRGTRVAIVVLGVLIAAVVVGAGPAVGAPAVPAPTGLTATAVSPSRVDVAWAAVKKASSYQVLRSTRSGGPYTPVATTSATRHVDTTVDPATAYFYVVTATQGGRTSGVSAQASATTPQVTPAPPVAPADLQASPDNAGIYLSWAPSSGASGYQVLRATTAGGPYGLIATTGTAVTHADFPPQQGVTFFYVVRALGGGGTSGNSNEAAAMTAPPTPTDFAAEAAAAGPTAGPHVALSWTAAPGATSYVLERATVGTEYEPLARVIEGTAHADFTVAPSTIYYYRLAAVNDSGWSKYVETKATTP